MTKESYNVIAQEQILVNYLRGYVIYDRKTYFLPLNSINISFCITSNTAKRPSDELNSLLISLNLPGHDWACMTTSNQ